MSINFTLSGFKTLGYSLMAGSIERICHYFCSSLSAHVKSMEIKSKDEPLPNNILKTEKKWLVTLDFLCAEYTQKMSRIKMDDYKAP